MISVCSFGFLYLSSQFPKPDNREIKYSAMLPGPQPILTFTTVAPQGLHWDPWSCPPAKVILLSQWADQEKIKQLVSSKFVLEPSSFAVRKIISNIRHTVAQSLWPGRLIDKLIPRCDAANRD